MRAERPGSERRNRIREEQHRLKTMFSKGGRFSELGFKAMLADSGSRFLGTMNSLTDIV
jgi:hypothetical protein